MNKNNTIIAILLFSVKVNIYSCHEQKYYKLDDDCFKFLDGVPNCFDKGAIWEMQYLRLLTRNLREKGILHCKKKECIMIDGKQYSIIDLALMEEKKDQNNTLQLKEALKKAKIAYIKFTADVRKRMAKVKKFFGQIIKESCQKRNIRLEDSLLVEWSNIKNNEECVFYDKIRTFKSLNQFLIQFYNFLGDLIYSCPKGYSQYIKEYKRIKNQKNNGTVRRN